MLPIVTAVPNTSPFRITYLSSLIPGIVLIWSMSFLCLLFSSDLSLIIVSKIYVFIFDLRIASHHCDLSRFQNLICLFSLVRNCESSLSHTHKWKIKSERKIRSCINVFVCERDEPQLWTRKTNECGHVNDGDASDEMQFSNQIWKHNRNTN